MSEAVDDQIMALRRDFVLSVAEREEDIVAAQKLRYQVYCRERNFLQGKDGHESDEYDDHSHQILLRHRSGEIIGTVRLIKSDPTQPHRSFPMQHVCGANVVHEYPLDKTAEISRFAISRDLRDHSKICDPLLRLALMRGVLEVSRKMGLGHWCAVMEPSLLRLLKRASVHFEQIGPAVDYHGQRIPVAASIDAMLQRGRVERPSLWQYVTDFGRLASPTGSRTLGTNRPKVRFQEFEKAA